MLGDSVVFPQMPFRLIPKVFDAIDVILVVRKKLAMIHPIVFELRHIQRVVGAIIVSIDNYQAQPSLG